MDGTRLARVNREPVTEERLHEIVVRIVANCAPEQIVLFGSYAYGSPTPDSDVDLLVIMESDIESRMERTAQVGKLFPARPFPMDILVYTPQELEEQRDRFNPFLYEVLKKGRVLYARSGLPGVRPGGRWWKEDGGAMSDDPVRDSMIWIEKAEQDYQMAYAAMQMETSLFDMVCFHAQQCVEKLLKAFLVQRQVFFPKTHDLKEIYELCRPAGFDLVLDEADLDRLSDYAVLIRYPNASATPADAEFAIAFMDAVRPKIRPA
ncbi:MAG: HEPN domain-containing protein [Anaerolineae bacterium]|nr:HEPN domain-containing protein [Anaerolineae bacterium]